ncbi:hypothetical protein AB0K00_50445 [Dactylosporangium sp. NPDC049525]|uniref:hypothetical protein n=1 Tax=Dactylosporangium sp. NPDC049525 TaxID=3154730 RepID=UPI00343DCE2C
MPNDWPEWHMPTPGRALAEGEAAAELTVASPTDSSEVTVTGCQEQDIPGLLAIATSLAANLFGDDGERYTEDGIVS